MAFMGVRTGRVGARDDARLPHQVVDYGRGPAALRAMREGIAATSELSYDGAADRFTSRISTFHLSSALLLRACVPQVRYDRSPLLVARSGFDHYLVVVYLRGRCRQWIGSREIEIAPGDVGVIDLTYPARTLVEPARGAHLAEHITMILPRARLAPLLPGSDALGQQLIRGDRPYGRILRGLLVDLWRHAGELSLAEAEPAIQAAAMLVAGGVRPVRGRGADLAPIAHAAARAEIQHFLDRQDTTPDQLGVAALCRRFRVSRATLYRMFEPDGGLMHHVRERQLRRALGAVASPAHRHLRIIDIALQYGFATESGFIRAFRRQFGITPGEARAEPLPAHAGAAAGARAMSWFLALASAPSSSTRS
jgi:AraC-like DNA-binding protein